MVFMIQPEPGTAIPIDSASPLPTWFFQVSHNLSRLVHKFHETGFVLWFWHERVPIKRLIRVLIWIGAIMKMAICSQMRMLKFLLGVADFSQRRFPKFTDPIPD